MDVTLKHNEGTQTFYDPAHKIWRGPQIPIRKDTTVGKAVFDALIKNPNQIAQICHHNGKKYTNQDFATWAIRVAQHLQDLEIKTGDIIGICCANSDFLAPVVFGSLFEGCAISTLDPSIPKDGIKHIYSLTRPKLMFCDGSNYERVKEAFKEIGLASKIYTIRDHIQGVPDVTELLKQTGKESDYNITTGSTGDDLAVILCSSGTTGPPKGVCLSHNMFLNSKFLIMKPDDVIICISSLHWISGIMCLIHPTIEGIPRVIDSRGFTTKTFFEIIENYKATVTVSAMTQLVLAASDPDIKKYNLSSLRVFLAIGNRNIYSHVEYMQQLLPNCAFLNGYGMSEMNGTITLGPSLPDKSSGQLAPLLEAKIINDAGESLGPNEIGEILLRHPFKWAGYYGNPEATKLSYDQDRWLHSGDLGYFNEAGFIFIVERVKDVCKYLGSQYFPTEIEHVISEIPGVRDLCVCGLPDEVSGDIPAAAIIKHAAAVLTEKQIKDYVAEKMEDFKQLRGGVYFFDELPRTTTGKPLRSEVVKLCEERRNKAVAL